MQLFHMPPAMLLQPLLLLLVISPSLGSPHYQWMASGRNSRYCECLAEEDVPLLDSPCGSPIATIPNGRTFRGFVSSRLYTPGTLNCREQSWRALSLLHRHPREFWVATDYFMSCNCRHGRRRNLHLAATPSPKLVRCICIVESNCKRDIGCQPDRGSDSCGPYQIKLAYWTDASEQAGRKLGGDWKTCTTGPDNMACSEETFRNYMARYAQRCVGKGRTPTDEDFARIHNGGPRGCTSPNTLSYWNKVNACMQA